MNTLSDSLLVGILVTLVFGAICFYLYSRITQTEKRVNLLEKLLLDLKIRTEAQLAGPEFLGPDSVEAISGPAPLESTDVDENLAGGLMRGNGDFAYGLEGDDAAQDSAQEADDDEIHLYEELARRAAAGPTTPRNTPAQAASPPSSRNSTDSEAKPRATTTVTSTVLEDAQRAAQQFTSALTGSAQGRAASVSSRLENNYESMSVKELQSAVKSRGITPVPRLRKDLIDVLKRHDAGESTQSEKVTLDSFMGGGENELEGGVEGFAMSLEAGPTSLDQQFGEITETTLDEESD